VNKAGSVVFADRFNDDALRSLIAQGHPGATKLADQQVLASDFLDDGRLAKPHLPEALAELAFAIHLGNTARRTGRKFRKSKALRAAVVR